MKQLILGWTLILAVFWTAGAGHTEPKIVGRTIDYSAQGAVMKGYLAYDENIAGKRPGVLVVHEWWGLNDYARKRARMLAELGYTALAVDMYGEGKQAMHPDDARAFSSELMKNFEVAKARFMAGMEFLKQQDSVDPTRIAAIGYCMGGGVVLNMARQGLDLRGVASFHGGLTAVKPAQPGSVKAKILVLHGGADKFITPEQIEAFKQEMKSAGADFHFISYPGATHSFTNPEATELGKKFNMPVAYNPEADRQSWDELKEFLKKVFRE
ncbi:MAG TPA: dienelactone hydrolase family protein [Thermodesulfobacteriota bacterium]|nr:dienelactone hydrolase family protein [Thermodesulfobacteriota bacterium]